MKTKFSLDEAMKSLSTPNPARDWMIVLALCALIFIALAGYATYLFVQIRWGDGTGQAGGASAPQQAVTKAQLDAEILKYQARQDAFEARDFGLPKLSDPAQ